MTVLEIKKALECCYAYVLNDRDTENCHECPYITYILEPCFDKLIKDVLKIIDELEKRNEPMPVVYTKNIFTFLPVAHCPKCGKFPARLYTGEEEETKFCPWCGQAVKWE